MTTKAMEWWQWPTARRRLEVWVKGLLRGRRYRVHLDPECKSAYHDSRGIIVANPCKYGETDEEQWQATRGLLAHEAGHALFTGPHTGQKLLDHVVNMLEDQRIEWGIARLYPGVGPDIRVLGDLVWAQSKAKAAEGAGERDAAEKLLSACLAWRWAWDRDGHEALVEALALDEAEETLWLDEVRPLVEAAWDAPAYEAVVEAARQVLAVLGLPEGFELPEWLAVLMTQPPPDEGAACPERSEREWSRRGGLRLPAGLPGICPAAGGSDRSPPLPLGGDETPLDYKERDRACRGKAVRIPPEPFEALEERARPLAARLAAELALPVPDARPMAHAWRGRYSFRQEVRDEERPFLLGQAAQEQSDGLAVQALVDRSGSMDYRMYDVQVAVMALHLACEQLSVPLSVTAFGGGNDRGSWRDPLNVVTVQDFDEPGEVPRARIAGLWGHTAAEHLILALRQRGPKLAGRPEGTKLLLVIHDGEPVYANYPEGTDWDLSLAWLKTAPKLGILPIGLLLVEDVRHEVEMMSKMRQLFQWLIVCRSEELPAKLGNLLRSFV